MVHAYAIWYVDSLKTYPQILIFVCVNIYFHIMSLQEDAGIVP